MAGTRETQRARIECTYTPAIRTLHPKWSFVKRHIATARARRVTKNTHEPHTGLPWPKVLRRLDCV